MDKAIGYTKISFKKNDGKWHFLDRTDYFWEEPFTTREVTHSYEEFISKDIGDIQRYFTETKDSIFPWGKKCLYWSGGWDESEWIYPEDSLTFKIEWAPGSNVTFNKLMHVMRADDFIEYCKYKGVSVCVNT